MIDTEDIVPRMYMSSNILIKVYFLSSNILNNIFYGFLFWGELLKKWTPRFCTLNIIFFPIVLTVAVYRCLYECIWLLLRLTPNRLVQLQEKKSFYVCGSYLLQTSEWMTGPEASVRVFPSLCCFSKSVCFFFRCTSLALGCNSACCLLAFEVVTHWRNKNCWYSP